MNNFKGGGFKKGGGKFGNKPKFGGGERKGGKSFGGDRGRGGRSSGSSESFKATCAECHKSCDVPFKPSHDKPVYCSECFGRRLSNNETRGESHGGRNSKPNQDKLPRDQRSPRHKAVERKHNAMLFEMKQQMTTLEEKMNRILEIINPPTPSAKKSAVAPKKESPVRKEKKEVKAVKKTAKKTAKKATKKTVKKMTKKATKKVVKKTVKKAAKKKATKK